MKYSIATQLNLGHSLSRRLYPVSLGITLLISLCFPATYFFLEYKGAELTALHHASKTADKIKGIIIASPDLWKYQIYTLAEIRRETFQDSKVDSLRIYDAKGQLIPDYGHQQQAENYKAWWHKWSPRNSANIVFNNETVGRVEIVISQNSVMLRTALLFFISSCVGLLLAFLSYKFPISVVQKLETELQKMFDDIQQAYKESNFLRHEAQSSEKRFRDLVDSLDAIVWEADADTRQFTFISRQVENLFHFKADEWLYAADFFKEKIFAEDCENVIGSYLKAIELERDCQLEYRRIARDGSIIWVRDNIRVIQVDADKKQLRGVIVNVTSKRQAEEALNKVNNELNQSVRQLERCNREISVLHEMSEMLQLCRDRQEAYQIIAVAAEKLFPLEAGAFYMLEPSRNLLNLSCTFGKKIDHEASFSPDSCWALRRRNSARTLNKAGKACKNRNCNTQHQVYCIPMLSQDDIIGVFHLNLISESNHFINSKKDSEADYLLAVSMTEHVALAITNLSLRETLRDLSIRDPLTSLYNRRYLEDTLLRELVIAERMKRELGIIMIDIDHFKNFNDMHGHDAGDTLLREFGRFLVNNIREYDIACRYGGEEFICILPETTLIKALERAEELRIHLMSFKVEHLGRPLEKITFSAGVAIYPMHGTSGSDLVKAADRALYQAKRDGRNRVLAAQPAGVTCQ